MSIYAPLQDCVYRKLEKPDMQDGKSDQLRPTMAQWHLYKRKFKEKMKTLVDI